MNSKNKINEGLTFVHDLCRPLYTQTDEGQTFVHTTPTSVFRSSVVQYIHMENSPTGEETTVPKKNALSEVTTLSKTLAAILFIILPFLGFWLGAEYSKKINSDIQATITPVANTKEQTPQNEIIVKESVAVVERLTIPEDDFWISAQTAIFKGYLSKKVLGKDEVMGALSEGETITCDIFTITEGDLGIFYKYLGEDKIVKVTQDELPYEIYIGNGDVKTLPQMTQEILSKSSPTTPVLVAITEYVNSSGKGLDTCESEIELFIAL